MAIMISNLAILPMPPRRPQDYSARADPPRPGVEHDQSSVVRPPKTRGQEGEEGCPRFMRKTSGEPLSVCITSAGLRDGHRRGPIRLDADRRLGEQGGWRASGV